MRSTIILFVIFTFALLIQVSQSQYNFENQAANQQRQRQYQQSAPCHQCAYFPYPGYSAPTTTAIPCLPPQNAQSLRPGQKFC